MLIDTRVRYRGTSEGGEDGAPMGAGRRHWREDRDAEGIHWLILDKADSHTNTLSTAVIEQLDGVLKGLEADLPKGVVIRSAKANGFIAGADISEFTQLKEAAAVKALALRTQAIFNRLERLSVPTVALIHGFCLGGGLELALACRYRIARQDASLGLPEIKLGIHPGFGGSVRLTRLLPAPTAMDLMLTGRILDAKTAGRLGLVDVVAQERHLMAAVRTALHNGIKIRYSIKVALLNNVLLRASLARAMRRKVAAKVRPEHYPAPYALIDLWERHGGNPARMQEAEADSVARLLTGETAQNLIRVFFLRERLKSLGRKTDFAVKHVHVIGAGVMGGDIAAWSALQGLNVTLYDRDPALLAPAIKRATELFKKRLKEEVRVREALDRLFPDNHGYGLAQADVVIEAIYEDRDAKQDLYRQIESQLKPQAVLATNTSSIPLDDLARALERPERLVGLHFFNPVAKMQLVEVIRCKSTDPVVLAKGQAFTRRIDRLPLPVQSAPGFLVNRVLMPYLMEAVAVLEEGGNPTAIDSAAEAFGMPMGPLELADSVGLDICLHVGEILARELGSGNVPNRLRELVEQGQLGRKSGQGFYRYKDGKPEKPTIETAADAEELQDRLLLSLLNECVACLREQVVEDADLLDAGMIFATGFAPFRGGPMHYLQSRGRDELLRRLGELEQRYGKRFHPDPGWASIAGKEETARSTSGG